jgi:hypothetical protein
MRTSGFRNIFGGGAGGGGGLTDGRETGLTPGFSCDDPDLPAGFGSVYPQNPQNAVPSGLSLPHCPHAGIRSPSLPYRIFTEPANKVCNCPQPRFPLYQNPLLRDGAQAIADDCTDMKATAGARKVNMADENSLNVKSAPPSYFIVATFWLAGRARHF